MPKKDNENNRERKKESKKSDDNKNIYNSKHIRIQELNNLNTSNNNQK